MLKILPLAVLCFAALGAEEALLTSGERVAGPVSLADGSWTIGGKSVRAGELLVIRFSPEPPPARMASGVFIRGGSLIAGTLSSLVGDSAEVASAALGTLKLQRDNVAGAFSPPPPGQPENIPELAHYARLLGAALGHSATLSPGRRCRVKFAGLDAIDAERVMRVGSEQVLLAKKDKSVETVNRQFVRLIEFQVPELPAAPGKEDEVIVRLKAGDLLRGRVKKLDGRSLLLQTDFMGEKSIDRGTLAALFPAGGAPVAPASAPVVWLSTLKPSKAAHTPLFDSEFPHRMDASVDGGDMVLKGFPCERGIGVHSKSELVFDLPAGVTRFVALCGIDAETRGRGVVAARVLADGKELWQAEMSGQDAPRMVSVDLGGARTLTLQVDFGADEDDSGDHFDWGWAALVR